METFPKFLLVLLVILITVILITIGIAVLNVGSESESSDDKSVKNIGITKVEYEGHTYLIRSEWHGNFGFGGICHDENCKCKNDSI